MFRTASLIFSLVLVALSAHAETLLQPFQFGDWLLVCSNTAVQCTAEVEAKNATGVPSVQVSYELGDESLELVFTLPPEAAHLRTIAVETAALRGGLLPLHKCTETCKAYWHVLKEDVPGLLGGVELVIVYAVSDKDGVQVRLPLDDLKDAVEYLKKSAK